MKRQLLSYILTLLCAATACADGQLQLYSKNISIKDGLPSNQVQDLLQDETGYIWIGTNNGLCRYDGYATVTFPNVGRGEGTTRSDIGTLALDAQNSLLWMRTATFNYACYDLKKECFRQFTGDCDPQKTFHRFVTEPAGIWMYEQSGAIRHVAYRNSRFTCQDFSQDNGLQAKGRIKQLLPEEGKGVWVISDKALSFIDNNGHVKDRIAGEHILIGNKWGNYTFFMNNNYELRVFRDGKQYKTGPSCRNLTGKEGVNGSFVWQDKWVILMRSGVLVMDCHNFTFERPDEMQMNFGILLDEREGDYWVSDRDNVLHLFPKTGRHKTFRLLNDIGYNIARKRRFSIARGTKGKHYIASYGNGLFVYDTHTGETTHFSANDKQPLLASNYLTNILTDRDGGIWISQEDGGLVYIKEEQLPTTDYVFPAADRRGEIVNYISQLKPQPDGTVSIDTRSRMTFTFQPATNSIQQTGMADFDILPGDSINDRQGRTWKMAWEQGLTLITPQPDGRKQQQLFLNRNTNESRINDIAMDGSQRLWIATYNGLYWVDTAEKEITDKSFNHYNTQTGLTSNQLLCVMVTAGDTIWTGGVGTGIVRCVLDSDGHLQTAVAITGQQFNNIHSLVSDRQGNVWAGSDEAILWVQPQQMKAAAFRPGTSFLNRIYSKNCALLLDDNRLMFGTHDGITIITPDSCFGKRPIGPSADIKRKPIITNIEVKGQSILKNENESSSSDSLLSEGCKNKEMLLDYDENSLTFYFSCLDYAHADEVVYRCYMEGSDHKWRKATGQHRMDYNNLPPGKYVFHVQTIENSDEALFTVIIRQPWWNTWWAWTLYLLFIGIIVYTFYRHHRERFKLQQQMKMERQLSEFRTNLFTNITHEFRTPLAIIKGAVDKLANDGSNHAAQQTALRATSRMLRMVNQFMEYRKIKTGNLRLEVEQADIVFFVRTLMQDLRTMAQQKDQQFTFTPSDKHFEMMFDKQKVETILYNLLSNAIKYTPERGCIEIKMSIRPPHLVISVTDSGSGISQGQEGQLFKPFMHGYVSQGGMGIGLYTAQQMALAHHGQLTYQRVSPSGGSCFTLTLPTDDIYSAEERRQTNTTSAVSSPEPNETAMLIREMQAEAINDLTIVIIEDDPDMMQQISAEMGVYFHTKCFSSGQAALEYIGTTGGEDTPPSHSLPSLIICDVMLPDIDGYQIVSRLKNATETAAIPVIMLTALGDESHQIKAYKVGADDYMVKPCNFRLLIARSIQLIKWSLAEASLAIAPRDKEGLPLSQSPQGSVKSSSALLEGRVDKVFLEKLAMLTSQHLSDATFSVDRLAEMTSMGRTKFYGKVKQLTGLSPNKYLQEARLQRAAELLLEGELTVSEISYKVGIQDPSYFNKLFKSRFGVVPSKYGR